MECEEARSLLKNNPRAVDENPELLDHTAECAACYQVFFGGDSPRSSSRPVGLGPKRPEL